MQKIKNLIAASILLAALFSEAQNKSFLEDLSLKINYANTHSFESDLNLSSYEWEQTNYRTFRLGFGYDLITKSKLDYNFNLSIDWSKDEEEEIINDPFFDANRLLIGTSTGSDIYFVLETQFLYSISKNKNLKLMIAPQLNFRLFNDIGFSGRSGTNNLNNYRFDFQYTYENDIVRPSLALGLQYDLPVKLKMRLGAFYSYSFTPIQYGKYIYNNSNNIEVTGNWERKGHQAGITFQLFPFAKRR